MLYTDAKQIDLQKYKRFFVFGCSFTGYRWESWADLLSMEMDNAEYYNGGRSGAGQLFIASQLSQYINHYNIGEGDLVGVMWSTFYREDRYLAGKNYTKNWLTPGNIYTQREYPIEYIEKYACPRGMFIRDMTLIDMTVEKLRSAKFDSFNMFGVSMESQNKYTCIDDSDEFDDVIDMYNYLNNVMLPPLFETEFGGENWGESYTYFGHNDHLIEDYHPNIARYASYLDKIGFTLSDETWAKVNKKHKRYQRAKHQDEFGFINKDYTCEVIL